MSTGILPLAVSHWEVNDEPPMHGKWVTQVFPDTEYVLAWESFMRLKWGGYAAYLMFRGEMQAQANITPDIPSAGEVA